MSDKTTVSCTILDTGHCLAHEHLVLRGGRWQTIECHALVALIRHPRHGWGLWDTGYGAPMLSATARWPYALYAKATPLRLRPELWAAAQLPGLGLGPGDIEWIIVSHFHADHIAGLRDFPRARIIASAAAWHSVRGRQGFAALRRAFIPELLPDDIGQRLELIHSFNGPADTPLGPTQDLFGDGSLLLAALPGHAAGQMGLLARTAERRILFAADGAWLTRAVTELRLPHPLTYLFIDDRRAMRESLGKLHRFALAHPEVALIPTHCPAAFAREVAG